MGVIIERNVHENKKNLIKISDVADITDTVKRREVEIEKEQQIKWEKMGSEKWHQDLTYDPWRIVRGWNRGPNQRWILRQTLNARENCSSWLSHPICSGSRPLPMQQRLY